MAEDNVNKVTALVAFLKEGNEVLLNKGKTPVLIQKKRETAEDCAGFCSQWACGDRKEHHEDALQFGRSNEKENRCNEGNRWKRCQAASS